MQTGRAEEIVADILFPRPDQFHRGIHRLGDLHRLDHVIVLQTPAESSSQQGVMDLDRIEGTSQQLALQPLNQVLHAGHGEPPGNDLRIARSLARHPHLADPVMNVDRATHRLESGMGLKGQLIFGVETLDPLFHRRSDTLLRLVRMALRMLVEQLQDTLRAEIAMRTKVPLDLQQLSPFLRGPEVIGDHRHARIDLHHLPYAGRGQRLRRIEPLHPAAIDGGMYDGSRQQVGKLHVDAEHGASIQRLFTIHPRHRLSNDTECTRLLELDMLGKRHPRRHRRQLAIGGPMSACLVHHLTGDRLALPFRHSPALCRSGEQHLPGHRPRPTESFPPFADAGTSCGVLPPIDGILHRCLLHLDSTEIHLQLLRHEHR